MSTRADAFLVMLSVVSSLLKEVKPAKTYIKAKAKTYDTRYILVATEHPRSVVAALISLFNHFQGYCGRII